MRLVETITLEFFYIIILNCVPSLVCAERHHGTWKLNLDTFASLQTLIQRFVDANELLELQCLYAIQRYIKKIEFPPGRCMKIFTFIIAREISTLIFCVTF